MLSQVIDVFNRFLRKNGKTKMAKHPTEQADFITSAISRFLKIGGLVSGIGISYITRKPLALFFSQDSQEQRNLDFWLKNGHRIMLTLGRLKGGAMKIGQMISLQEGILPPEAMAIIRLLQQDAPSLPFEKMLPTLEEDLGDYQRVFKSIEPNPYASASIGQVHQGVLLNGQDVAIKIQYPQIEKVIQSDLKNLKALFRILLSSLLKIDTNAFWQELNQRLMAETDYIQERKNQQRFHDLIAALDFIKIPPVFPHASSQRVLTSSFLRGLSLDEVEKQKIGQEIKDTWGQNLFRFHLYQLLHCNLMHTDPNIANYNFHLDGSIIVYDFGSVKEISKQIQYQYHQLFILISENRLQELPKQLQSMGVHLANGHALEFSLLEPLIAIFEPIFCQKDYRFDNQKVAFDILFEWKKKHWLETMHLVFPAELIFINRSFAGLFGNLHRLKAGGNWSQIAHQVLSLNGNRNK